MDSNGCNKLNRCCIKTVILSIIKWSLLNRAFEARVDIHQPLLSQFSLLVEFTIENLVNIDPGYQE